MITDKSNGRLDEIKTLAKKHNLPESLTTLTLFQKVCKYPNINLNFCKN